MSERIITLTAGQIAELRGTGQTHSTDGATGRMVRLLTADGGYRALPGVSGQVVLTAANLDLIEQGVAGLVCASTDGTTGWTVRAAE